MPTVVAWAEHRRVNRAATAFELCGWDRALQAQRAEVQTANEYRVDWSRVRPYCRVALGIHTRVGREPAQVLSAARDHRTSLSPYRSNVLRRVRGEQHAVIKEHAVAGSHDQESPTEGGRE